MAKIKTPNEYREELEELNEIRARREKPVRTKRKLEGEVSAYGVELEAKETRRPKQSPKPGAKGSARPEPKPDRTGKKSRRST